MARPTDASPAVRTNASSFWTHPVLALRAVGQNPGNVASLDPNSADQAATDAASAARRALAFSRTGRLNVLRVSQLDGELLDTELTGMVKEQFSSIFSLFDRRTRDEYDPEITAFLQYLMCHMSIYSMGATYGLQLQNLKYRNEARHGGNVEVSAIDAPLSTWQKIAHAIAHVGGRWGWLRINRYATTHEWSERPEDDWRNKTWQYLQKGETIYKVLSLANFLVFLYNGKYRSVLDRILRMRLVYNRREMNRQVSFEFMNRQLVWHAFTEFLLFLVPLINVERVKNSVARVLSGPVTLDLPEHICPVCHSKNVPHAKLHTPYKTNCGHLYCYYCIKTSMMMDNSFACMRCGQKVTEISRHMVTEKIADPSVEKSLEKEGE
ncbi:Pex12 amino terminal region-domain-containing protein [Phlyctochytrium arcticum]|nr:Pex12 amino terminal region-domain-containing protein [Phlyctochytrium arcticum]